VVDQLRYPIRLHADAAFLVLDLPRNTHHSRHALSSSFLQPQYLIIGYYKLAKILATTSKSREACGCSCSNFAGILSA
jgi:hypothetical protein